MRSSILGVIALALAASASLAGAGLRAPEKPAMLDRFKQLAGDWVSKTGEQVSYKVTSGGTAVVETIGPGTDHEMITVITADGDGLALTHYCMLNNQPQMRAAATSGKSVPFQFVRATNMKSLNDMHMHSVTYTFVDKETLKATWTNWNKGKPAGTVVFVHTRKK